MRRIYFLMAVLLILGAVVFVGAEEVNVVGLGNLEQGNFSGLFPKIDCSMFLKNPNRIDFWVKLAKDNGKKNVIFDLKKPGQEDNFVIDYNMKRRRLEVELRLNNKTQWLVSTPDRSVSLDKRWRRVTITHNGIQPKIFIDGRESSLLWLKPVRVSAWLKDIFGSSGNVKCSLGYSGEYENLFSGELSVPLVGRDVEKGFEEVKKVSVPLIKCGKWGRCINYYQTRKCKLILGKTKKRFAQKRECGVPLQNESEEKEGEGLNDTKINNTKKEGEKEKIIGNKSEKIGKGEKVIGNESTERKGGELEKPSKDNQSKIEKGKTEKGVLKNQTKKKVEKKVNKTKEKTGKGEEKPKEKVGEGEGKDERKGGAEKKESDKKKAKCKKVCKKECHKECSDKCEEKTVCKKECSEDNDGKKECRKVCEPKKVCKPVCKNMCQKKCTDSCDIPDQLFDITFELEKQRVSKSNELTVWITLQNFGRESVPARMIFDVYDSNGKEVYREFQETVVYTDRLFVKKFGDMNLGEGKYRMAFHVEYADVREDFEGKFEVSKSIWQRLKEFLGLN